MDFYGNRRGRGDAWVLLAIYISLVLLLRNTSSLERVTISKSGNSFSSVALTASKEQPIGSLLVDHAIVIGDGLDANLSEGLGKCLGKRRRFGIGPHS